MRWIDITAFENRPLHYKLSTEDTKIRLIDITGYDKAQVLAALYYLSEPFGMGFLDPKHDHVLTVSQARELLETQQQFDYLRGHPLKVDLKYNNFDASHYDRYQGRGTAEIALKLCAKQSSLRTVKSTAAIHLANAFITAASKLVRTDNNDAKMFLASAFVTAGFALARIANGDGGSRRSQSRPAFDPCSAAKPTEYRS